MVKYGVIIQKVYVLHYLYNIVMALLKYIGLLNYIELVFTGLVKVNNFADSSFE